MSSKTTNAYAANNKQAQPIWVFLGILCLFFISIQGFAQQNKTHLVEEGETLSKIAYDYYKAPSKWTRIYYFNKDKIGPDPVMITKGMSLTIPMGQPDPVDPVPDPQGGIEINLLTASDYAPFTDKDWPHKGMITEIVKKAFQNSPTQYDYKVNWINDWSAHLDPLLSGHSMDMGFPWLQPNCSNKQMKANLSEDMRYRCNFVFSDPIFETLIVFFKKVEGRSLFNLFSWKNDPKDLGDFTRKTIARPKGYYTFDLQEQGFITEPTIEMRYPKDVGTCFQLLVDKEVDYVTLNEFTGRNTIREMGLQEKVRIVESFNWQEGIYILVHKDHPKGTQLIEDFNAGLGELKENGEYKEIVNRHLARFYSLND